MRPLPKNLLTPTALTPLLDAWVAWVGQVRRGDEAAYCEKGWAGTERVRRSVEVVQRLVVEPRVAVASEALHRLLTAIGPTHYPVSHATRAWLMSSALETWVSASTVGSAQRVALTQVFLNAGTPPNGEPDATSTTPLHQAVELGDLALVQHLVAAGADPWERRRVPPDSEGTGPTRLERFPETFPYVRQYGETLLHAAAIHNHGLLCEWLIGLGLPLTAALRPNGTPGRTPEDAARDNDSHRALAVIEGVLLREVLPPPSPSAVGPAGPAAQPPAVARSRVRL